VVRFTVVVSFDKEIEKLTRLRVEERVRGIGEESTLDKESLVPIQGTKLHVLDDNNDFLLD